MMNEYQAQLKALADKMQAEFDAVLGAVGSVLKSSIYDRAELQAANGQLLLRLRDAEARLRTLEAQNDPVLDCTDAAHPAWWRGHDHTTERFCQRVTDLLDGKDDGKGVGYEPWETVRRRLLQLVPPSQEIKSEVVQ